MIDEKYNDFLIVRPKIDGVDLDNHRMPIIKKMKILEDDFKKIKVTNFSNLNSIVDRENTILDTFNYDNVLKRLWNDPLKYVAKFQGLFAVASPDFSVYPGMNPYEIEHNVFMSRWLGALWQSFGINVIPTISWADEDTYDVCFSGVEKSTIVIISTLGVDKNFDMFISGFNEMKKRIKPKLIIVVGKIYDEMEGEFLHFNQRKSFYQLSLFDVCNYIKRKDGNVTYGW